MAGRLQYKEREGTGMSKKLSIVVSVLAVIAICLSAAALIVVMKPAPADHTDVQYVMYLGTNGAETNEPVFAPGEAREKAKEILVKHFGGYTLTDAEGGWEDSGTLYQEYTLVIYLSDTTLDKVHAAADELIRTFQQSSVLIQSNRTVTEFYSGTK